ncbi:hypothetical protein [Pseudomonas chlororaphis]|uniref:hypothetical protein n=1 Tax=Pseudomonas chlororaphis TaxID=587753 RepID=UPI003D0DEDB3
MGNKASFNWIDPLLLDQQLSEEERMVRDSAQQFHGAGGFSSRADGPGDLPRDGRDRSTRRDHS